MPLVCSTVTGNLNWDNIKVQKEMSVETDLSQEICMKKVDFRGY